MEKKKRIGLLKNEITTPKEIFDITKSSIEPINLGLDELQAKDKQAKVKKYKMIRCPEQLKHLLDDLQQINNDKSVCDTIEKMYDFYIANSLNEEQKRSLKILKTLREQHK